MFLASKLSIRTTYKAFKEYRSLNHLKITGINTPDLEFISLYLGSLVCYSPRSRKELDIQVASSQSPLVLALLPSQLPLLTLFG